MTAHHATPMRAGLAAAIAGLIAVSCLAARPSSAFASRLRPAATTTEDCSVLSSGGTCSFGAPSNPSVPYVVTIPSGVTAIEAIVEGGTGATGDGAAGGAGGVVVTRLAVVGGEQLQLYVAANGNSYNQPGAGWAAGGDGVEGVLPNLSWIPNEDSGAGGGASAVVDTTSGVPLVIAAGGGGAGGTYNDTAVGGAGGAGGSPAGDGSQGGSQPGGKSADGGGPGGPGGAASQTTGAAGNDLGVTVGGGGGGGGAHGGGGGEPAGAVADAGGGGGGGLSAVSPQASDTVYASALSANGGSVSLSPAGSIATYPCNGSTGNIVNLASATNTVFAVAAGASGTRSSDDDTTPGDGAVVTARLHPNGEQQLSVTAGCRRSSIDHAGGTGDGAGGGQGIAGDGAGDDGGDGGGASYIGDNATGNAWLIAGGGGGTGGAGSTNPPGGNGGDAGLGWGSAGAGSGGDGTGGNPPKGGPGGDNTSNGQPVAYGDTPERVCCLGGGGGGGGGGLQGGQGGDTITDFDGGGGGGAGSSTFDPSHAIDPTVATSSEPYGQDEGFVVLVQEDTGATAEAPAVARSRHAPSTAPARAASGSATGSATGSLTVRMRVRGNGARAHASSVFGLRLTCRVKGRDLRLPNGEPPIFGLTAGRSRTFSGLPVGARCRTDQTNSDWATSSAIGGRRVSIGAGATMTTVTNRFVVGSLTVRLTPAPHATRRQLATRLPIYIRCRPAGALAPLSYPLPNGGYESVRPRGRLVLLEVPVGAHCAVAPLDQHYASTARIDPRAVVTAHGHATLRITDHLATRRYRIAISAGAGRPVIVTVRSDDRVSVGRGRHGDGVSAKVRIAPSGGFVQIVNHRRTAITVRVSRGDHLRLRTRVRGGRIFLFRD